MSIRRARAAIVVAATLAVTLLTTTLALAGTATGPSASHAGGGGGGCRSGAPGVGERGAMTLQVLRNQVGDRDLFRILRTWAQRKAGGNGTTGQFIALAERISGEQLDALFDAWLFTPAKPALPTAMATGATARVPATAASAPRTPPAAATLLKRMSSGRR
jgi:hypothetical protein